MTLYNIGPGQTYETFTELVTAENLQPADIVSGILAGSTPFEEQWTPDGSGTAGNVITLKEAVIRSSANRGVYLTSRDYITLVNLDIADSLSRCIDVATSDNVTVNGGVTSGQVGVWNTDSDILILIGTTHNNSITAIRIDTSTKTVTGTIITNPIITTASQYGLYFTGDATYNILDSVVTNPIISGTIFSGISLSYVDGFVLTGGSVTGTSRIEIRNSTDVEFTNLAVADNTGEGIFIDNSTLVSLSGCTVDRSGVNGINLTDSSSITVIDSIVSGSIEDGVKLVSGVTNSRFSRNIVKDHAAIVTEHGDAFTSHTGCTGNIFDFNFSTNNNNTAHAHVSGATGEIYHHTSYNDIPSTGRAVFYLATTGAWIVKNNLLYNNNGDPIAECNATPDVTADYNCYISNTLTAFTIGASTEQTFTQWIAAIGNETNSIFIHINGSDYDVYLGSAPGTISITLNYCPVNLDGTLEDKVDNPLINTGIFIAGVNNGGELDLFGNFIYKLPNMGVDQLAGTPFLAGQIDNIISDIII